MIIISDMIAPILNHFSTDDSVVGISPKLLNTDGSIQVQGSGIAGLKYKTSNIKQVSFLSGASLFIKTSFFKKLTDLIQIYFFIMMILILRCKLRSIK